MIITKTKKWGNSLGIIIPKNASKQMNLREGQEIEIKITPKTNVLKEMFGFAKGKITKSTEEILRENRKGLSKHF